MMNIQLFPEKALMLWSLIKQTELHLNIFFQLTFVVANLV